MWIKKPFVYQRPLEEEETGAGEDKSPIVNDSGEVEGTGNEDRLARMNAIADKADEERGDELADVNDDDTTTPFRAKPADETPPEPESGKEQTPPENASQVQKVKIKVNGKELELTQEELIERAQKVESADEYLRRAKETVKKEPPVTTPTGPTQEEIQRQQDAEDRALVRAIQMGTEEEAAAALRKLREQTARSVASPSVSTDDILRSVDERLVFSQAKSKFEQEYNDIVSDPYLYKLMLERDSAQLDAGDIRSYYERWSAIGEELRSWTKKFAPAEQKQEETPAPPTTLKAKLERKEQAPREPVKANRKNEPPPPEEEEDDNPHAVIANMAKARGGPQWMRG